MVGDSADQVRDLAMGRLRGRMSVSEGLSTII